MCLRLFLVTANVGSVFENIDNGLKIWMQEVVNTVQAQQPEFIAFHFQETGGKFYQNGSDVIQIFFNVLVENFKAIGFSLAEGYIDSDSDLQQQFTALSSVYFIRDGVDDIQIWNFQEREFSPISSSKPGQLFIGKDLQLTERKQKHKFPQHFFPNFKWSRKGFLRTRWRLKGAIVDLVNIHLFHDSSNIVASSSFPSEFAENRQKTLNYVLDLFHNDDLENHPMFIFGDFNFRVDTFNVFTLLQNDLNKKTTHHHQRSNNNTLQEGQFFVDSKSLVVKDHEERFKYNFNWLLPYDFEAKKFENLLELEVKFHPTYPFDEDKANQFMRTRCPSWCDRVLFNSMAKFKMSTDKLPEYDLIGSEVCMGDHKPVYLTFDLKTSDNTSNHKLDPKKLDKSPVDSPGAGRNLCKFNRGSSPSSICSNTSSITNPALKNRKHTCGLVTFLKDNLRRTNNNNTNKNPIENDTTCTGTSTNSNWKLQNQSTTFENELSSSTSTKIDGANNLILFSSKDLIIDNSNSCTLTPTANNNLVFVQQQHEISCSKLDQSIGSLNPSCDKPIPKRRRDGKKCCCCIQ